MKTKQKNCEKILQNDIPHVKTSLHVKKKGDPAKKNFTKKAIHVYANFAGIPSIMMTDIISNSDNEDGDNDDGWW